VDEEIDVAAKPEGVPARNSVTVRRGMATEQVFLK
jgi:hypothetical protein